MIPIISIFHGDYEIKHLYYKCVYFEYIFVSYAKISANEMLTVCVKEKVILL